jgi:putative phage-type endonuclease
MNGNLAEKISQHHTAESDWYQARRRGIGGSDIAAIMGLSRYKTPLQVYQEKIGEAGPIPDNWRMLVGRTLEPAIRQFYADATGHTVLVPESVITCPQYPFLLANLDGYTDEPRVVEIKTAGNGREWGEPGSSDIPTEYMCQVQHYMIVTGYEVADVVASISNREPVIYTVEADRELQEMMVDEAAAFWEQVQKGIPPEPTTYAEAIQKYGNLAVRGGVEASKEIIQAVNRLKVVKESVKAMEAEEERLKGQIILALGDKGDTLLKDGKPRATYRISKGSARFDAEAFKVAHADLYQQFQKTSEGGRRFLLK